MSEFWTVDRIIAMVAIGALVATVLQLYMTRNHNQNSLRPLLDIWGVVSLNEYKITFDIRNSGTGPAIIRQFKIYFDGKQYDMCTKLGMDQCRTAILESLPLDSILGLDRGGAIATNDKFLLLIFKDSSPLGEKEETLFSRIRIEIEYQSLSHKKVFTLIYFNKESLRKEKSIITNLHDWFKRKG